MDYFLSIVKRRKIELRGRSLAGSYNEAMPELPEVETIARGVDARVRGDQIVEAWFSGFKQPFKTSPKVQAAGWKEVGFWRARVGKHIVCALGSTYGGSKRNHVLVERKMNPIGSGLFTWA